MSSLDIATLAFVRVGFDIAGTSAVPSPLTRVN